MPHTLTKFTEEGISRIFLSHYYIPIIYSICSCLYIHEPNLKEDAETAARRAWKFHFSRPPHPSPVAELEIRFEDLFGFYGNGSWVGRGKTLDDFPHVPPTPWTISNRYRHRFIEWSAAWSLQYGVLNNIYGCICCPKQGCQNACVIEKMAVIFHIQGDDFERSYHGGPNLEDNGANVYMYALTL